VLGLSAGLWRRAVAEGLSLDLGAVFGTLFSSGIPIEVGRRLPLGASPRPIPTSEPKGVEPFEFYQLATMMPELNCKIICMIAAPGLASEVLINSLDGFAWSSSNSEKNANRITSQTLSCSSKSQWAESPPPRYRHPSEVAWGLGTIRLQQAFQS
jgi:hypothetical protein